MKYLVINSGSSSIKYQVLAMDTETVLASGMVERIGEDIGRLKNVFFPEPSRNGNPWLSRRFPTITAV